MKKYKITKEIAELYAKVMQMQGNVKKEQVAGNCDARVVSVNAILEYMCQFSHLSNEGLLVSEAQKDDFASSADTLYLSLQDSYDVNARNLRNNLNSLSPEPEPEPEPSFKEKPNNKFAAAKLLLNGSEGVVFAISSKEVKRFRINIDCDIAKQSDNLHAVLKALADSMGLINKEGETKQS